MPDSSDHATDAKLAKLRPGMTLADVAEAMGQFWRPPAPHKGGVVDVVENSHGVVVYLDKNDVIGSLSFDWRFKGNQVDGARMGMTLAEARELFPDMEIGNDLPMMRGVREGVRTLPGGALMRIRFTLEKVNAIALSTEDADYRERSAPVYAAPDGEPGAPFADVNFKLIVLSSLIDAKVLDLGTPEDLAAHVLGRDVDIEDEGYDLNPDVLDYLARYPLTAELLDQVETVRFDGGNNAYRFAWYFWGGADNTFDVADIGGIERCPNVKSVSATSMIDRLDIGKLTPLKRLTHLSISTGLADLEALRDLNALESLRLLDDKTYGEAITPGHSTRALFEKLKADGVAIQISPTSWKGQRPPPFE